MKSVTADAYVADSFDGALPPDVWEFLLRRGDSDVVFLTSQWLQAWWEIFGRGRLLLVVGLQNGDPVAVAPLFADSGMVFFVGSGGSDYLDFIGDLDNPDVFETILDAARSATPGFVGFRFYHVPDSSRTPGKLTRAAARLDLACFDEGSLQAPALELRSPQDAQAAANKKSLVRHERYFGREGKLAVRHFHAGDEILPHLKEFFDQHVDRWSGSNTPSLFTDTQQRDFFERLTERAADTGWLRFTRVDWNGSPIAFHWGTCYRSTYMWYKPTFAIEHARRSPGEVLLRSLLRAAGEEGAKVFDFGLGDEAFKHRFATRVATVTTWGLYPDERAGSAENAS